MPGLRIEGAERGVGHPGRRREVRRAHGGEPALQLLPGLARLADRSGPHAVGVHQVVVAGVVLGVVDEGRAGRGVEQVQPVRVFDAEVLPQHLALPRRKGPLDVPRHPGLVPAGVGRAGIVRRGHRVDGGLRCRRQGRDHTVGGLGRPQRRSDSQEQHQAEASSHSSSSDQAHRHDRILPVKASRIRGGRDVAILTFPGFPRGGFFGLTARVPGPTDVVHS